MIHPGEVEIDELQLSGSFRVGDLQVHHVSDGVQLGPRQSWFTGIDPEVWTPVLGVDSADALFPVNYGCFVVVDQGEVTLVDSGWGPSAGTKDDIRAGGEMLTRLSELGIERGDIKRIIQTHLHADHCGWLWDEETKAPTFPNAEILISAPELDYWTGQEADDDPMAPYTRSRVLPCMEAGLVRVIDDVEYQVSPSMSLIPTPGHTAGHVVLHLESAGQHALLLGDVVHHPIHFTHFDWLPVIDRDPVKSVRSREAMARLAVELNAIVTAPHMPILTIGRVEVDSDGQFRFVEVTAEVAGA